MRLQQSFVATCFAAAALLVPQFRAMAEEPSTLTLRIEGIESASGDIRIGIYASEAEHKQNQALTGVAVPVDVPEVTTTIEGLEPGTYSVKVFHDVDGDGELATGRMGIPTEPWGISNDAPARFGPPSWTDAKLTLPGGDTIHVISLR